MKQNIKKPMNCANNSQAVNQKKQSHCTEIIRRVKLEFISLVVWLTIAKG